MAAGDNIFSWTISIAIVCGIVFLGSKQNAAKNQNKKASVPKKPKLYVVGTQKAEERRESAASTAGQRSNLKASSCFICIFVAWCLVWAAPYPLKPALSSIATTLTVIYFVAVIALVVLALRDAEKLKVESFIKKARILSGIIPGSLGSFWQLAGQSVHIYARGDGLRAYQILEQGRQRLITPLRFLAAYTLMLGERASDDALGVSKAAKYIGESRPSLGMSATLKVALADAYLQRNIVPSALEILPEMIHSVESWQRTLVMANCCAVLGLDEELETMLKNVSQPYVVEYYKGRCARAHNNKELAVTHFEKAEALIPQKKEGLGEETILSNIYASRIAKALKDLDEWDSGGSSNELRERARELVLRIK